MERKNLKKRTKQDKKEPISRKSIIITILMIVSVISGIFVFNFSLQLILDTKTPLLVVVSDSMEPNLHQGDLIIVRGVDPENIKESHGDAEDGDIIVFDAHDLWEGAPDTPIVHRVYDKYKEDGKWYFLTKGDANWHVDLAPIPQRRVLGKVLERIPYIGWVKIVLVDWYLFIPIGILLFIYIYYDIMKEKMKEEESKSKKEKINEEIKSSV